VDEWGKKKLAYEVQKMKEAFYYFIRFEAESTVPAEIESRFQSKVRSHAEYFPFSASAGMLFFQFQYISHINICSYVKYGPETKRR